MTLEEALERIEELERENEQLKEDAQENAKEAFMEICRLEKEIIDLEKKLNCNFFESDDSGKCMYCGKAKSKH